MKGNDTMEENRGQVMRVPPGAENLPSSSCPLERETWSTPVLIGLNAAAAGSGSETGPEVDTFARS
jgi:hypothetical protein